MAKANMYKFRRILSNTESRKMVESRERSTSGYRVPLELFASNKLTTYHWVTLLQTALPYLDEYSASDAKP
jgi:hypothetical protein